MCTLRESVYLSPSTVFLRGYDPYAFSSLGLVPHIDPFESYSATGKMELDLLKPCLIAQSSLLVSEPPMFCLYQCGKYGSGSHADGACWVLGSVRILACTDAESVTSKRHLVIQGSSEWLIVRSLTRRCDLRHISCPAIHLPTLTPADCISMINFENHTHLELCRFFKSGAVWCVPSVK